MKNLKKHLTRRPITFLLLAFVLLGIGTGCRTVRFNEKQRLGDRAMRFDWDGMDAEMKAHVLTPREGSVGGFSAIGAGGCGCN